MLLTVGAVLGFLSIALGAYVDHGLRFSLDEEALRSVLTALRYQQLHAVVIVIIGLVLLHPNFDSYRTLLTWAGWGFVTGIVLFSGGILTGTIASLPGLIALAPIGGTALMASWLLLAWIGLRS